MQCSFRLNKQRPLPPPQGIRVTNSTALIPKSAQSTRAFFPRFTPAGSQKPFRAILPPCPTKTKMIPLHLTPAAFYSIPRSLTIDQMEDCIVKNNVWLLSEMLNLKTLDDEERSLLKIKALGLATKHKNLTIVKNLIERNTNPLSTSIYLPESPLEIAVRGNSQEIVDSMLKLKFCFISANSVHSKLTSCFNIAVQLGHLNIVEQFIKFGIDPHDYTEKDHYPFVAACINGQLEMVKFLHKYGANPLHLCYPQIDSSPSENGLIGAATRGHISIIEWYIKNKINLTAFRSEPDNNNVLLAAIDCSQYKVAEFLIKSGLIDLTYENRSGANAYLKCLLKKWNRLATEIAIRIRAEKKNDEKPELIPPKNKDDDHLYDGFDDHLVFWKYKRSRAGGRSDNSTATISSSSYIDNSDKYQSTKSSSFNEDLSSSGYSRSSDNNDSPNTSSSSSYRSSSSSDIDSSNSSSLDSPSSCGSSDSSNDDPD